ncbi:MAG: FHA domain-containing protein [Merismopedia sp. SIO2A8]|nr:FHA domain-containing protein [Merismopedia sp. SIO2A8]
MLDSEQRPFYPSNAPSISGERDYQVQSRLALYQVFLRVYEQNRDLLNGILELEDSGNHRIAPSTAAYIQGIIVGPSVHLVTNLIEGRTQVVTAHDVHWTIGRDRRIAELPIADRRLSRRHATISYDAHQHQFQIFDLGSTNGTFVNGEQIVRQRHLNDGDRIRLGSLGFNFFTCHLPYGNEELPEHVMVSPKQEDALPQNDTDKDRQQSIELDKQTLTDGPVVEDTMVVPRLRPHHPSATSDL